MSGPSTNYILPSSWSNLELVISIELSTSAFESVNLIRFGAEKKVKDASWQSKWTFGGGL